jgi:sigma-70-like protein
VEVRPKARTLVIPALTQRSRPRRLDLVLDPGNVPGVQTLLLGVRERTTEDFEAFVTASASELTRLAVLLTRNRAGADDLVQSTLLKLWRSWSKVSSADDVPAYARRVMVNTAASWGRRHWSPLSAFQKDRCPMGRRSWTTGTG